MGECKPCLQRGRSFNGPIMRAPTIKDLKQTSRPTELFDTLEETPSSIDVVMAKTKQQQDDFILTKDLNGNTVLHCAIVQKKYQHLSNLLKYVKSPTAFEKTNLGGSNLVQLAAINGDILAMKALVHLPHMSTKALDSKSLHCENTSLMWSVIQGNSEMFKTLIQAGADPTLRNKKGESIVYKAAEFGDPQLLKQTLKVYPAGLDLPSRHGWKATPLIAAVQCNKGKAVAILLKQGCRPDLTDKRGWSASDYAADYDRKEILHQIEERISELQQEGVPQEEDEQLTRHTTIWELLADILFGGALCGCAYNGIVEPEEQNSETAHKEGNVSDRDLQKKKKNSETAPFI
mmetsp:Transcript_27697/g.41253  ORF Transcript_27697/g.41253 Transcript_27697/m.41253 type:complete len:347 (-) Transcript_27697:42-1082(-)